MPFKHTTTDLTAAQAAALARPASAGQWRVIEVRPPHHDRLPASITPFVQGIRELQSTRFGLRNASPIVAFELQRYSPDRLRFQYAVPTARVERKLRTHLTGAVPGVGFDEGASGLPVSEGDALGGAIFTTGRDDWYPLRADFPAPAVNAVVGALHPHAMRDTRFVLQVLLRPLAGRPVRRWWYTKRAYKQLGYLRKEKDGVWSSRQPTPRERRQADAIEAKVSQPLWWCSIRLVVIGAGEHTQSRIKELAGALAVFEHPETAQYLGPETLAVFRTSNLYRFARVVADRSFGQWSRKFRLTSDELGALLALPTREQRNVSRAQP